LSSFSTTQKKKPKDDNEPRNLLLSFATQEKNQKTTISQEPLGSLSSSATQEKKLEDNDCHDFNFGLTTKVKAWKGVGRKCNPRVTFKFPRVRESVRE